MGANKAVTPQESKEFQLKLVLEKGKTEDDYAETARHALAQAIVDTFGPKAEADLSGKTRIRHGVRYDVAGNVFKANDCTLAIEASDKATKLKCKLHAFVPELLFDRSKPEKALSFPTKADKKHEPRFKLEQDVHFDNIKFCASGSVELRSKPQAGDFATVGDFEKYFGRIDRIVADKKMPLVALSDWRETVLHKMTLRLGKKLDTEFTLVTRWDNRRNRFEESELSYKVRKDLDEDWDLDALELAMRLYLALQKNCDTFIQVPSIFFVDTPASSKDIELKKDDEE